MIHLAELIVWSVGHSNVHPSLSGSLTCSPRGGHIRFIRFIKFRLRRCLTNLRKSFKSSTIILKRERPQTLIRQPLSQRRWKLLFLGSFRLMATICPPFSSSRQPFLYVFDFLVIKGNIIVHAFGTKWLTAFIHTVDSTRWIPQSTLNAIQSSRPYLSLLSAIRSDL